MTTVTEELFNEKFRFFVQCLFEKACVASGENCSIYLGDYAVHFSKNDQYSDFQYWNVLISGRYIGVVVVYNKGRE